MSDGSAAHGAAFDSPATEDDLLVARFRELGAIILPPTTMTEGGVTPVGCKSRSQYQACHWYQARNPQTLPPAKANHMIRPTHDPVAHAVRHGESTRSRMNHTRLVHE